jgi:2-keto-4-pentenoate hydratase
MSKTSQMSPRIEAATRALLDARARRVALDGLSAAGLPTDDAEVEAIQERTAAALGGIGGWKVGAANPEAVPGHAPMPRRGLHESPATLAATDFFFVGLEAEIAFRFAKSLPATAAPFSIDDVLGAIGSVHAGIEIVDSRYSNWRTRGAREQAADLGNHGAYVLGPAGAAPVSVDQTRQVAELWIDGACKVTTVGGNTAGNVQRLLHWLANHCARRGLPIVAGDIVTSGSCTGLVLAHAGSRVEARLPGVGTATLLLS